MTQTIIEALNGFITREVLNQPDQTIAPEQPLISGGLIDSFSLVDIALFVEQEWKVRIDDTELNAEVFDSLAELAALIKKRQAS